MNDLELKLQQARNERDKILNAIGGQEKLEKKMNETELTPVETALWNKIEALNEIITECSYELDGFESEEYMQRILDRQDASEETLVHID